MTQTTQTIPELKVYLKEDPQVLKQRIQAAKDKLGTKLMILAHHYTKNAIVDFADQVGDSLQLAKMAQANKTAETIVFCGVHFMAETADMLTEDYQKVLLPNLRAGCSMADMADG